MAKKQNIDSTVKSIEKEAHKDKLSIEHPKERERLSNVLKKRSQHITHLIESKLWLKVLIALFLGSITGIFLGPDFSLVSAKLASIITEWLALPGNLFLQLIKMIMIPLVFSSIIIGIVSSGNPSFVKKIGLRVVIYFIITTIVAILIGLVLAFLIQPGKYFDATSLTTEVIAEETFQTLDISIPERIVTLVPSNPLSAMVSGDMLGVVLFTIIFGIALLFINEEHFRPTVNLLQTIQLVSMKIVKWAMHLVPIAVFGLSARVISKVGFQALRGLGVYMFTVFLGLVCLMGFYLLIIKVFTRRSPMSFLAAIREPQLLAFSTSSSAAVMPLSMKTAEDKLGIRPAISQFLIPVGATINMDGTALYQSVATIFLAQAFGVELSLLKILIIIAITVGASIGAPSVPGVGIVVLASILVTVGIPAAGIGLILGVDRILDMARTTLNVSGDLTACSFFNARAAELFEK